MTIPYTSSYDKTIPFSDTDYQIGLSTAAVQTITVPGAATQQYTALFSYNATANVFVGKKTGALSPVIGTTTSLQYVELRPKKRYVNGGDVLSFVTPDTTAYVGVSLRSIP